MVRLDANLLASTPSYLNPLKDRELDLRGHKIPAIENLGVTRDTLDSIDLTDNAITTLSNFPLLRRLQHLHLSNNPLRTISTTLPTSLPNLKSLILTNTLVQPDHLGSLGEILGKCKKLEIISLKGSPVVEREYYKEWLVWKCKKLRSLDFDRITDKDRALAKSLFLLPSGQPTPLALELTASALSTASSFTASNGLTKTFEPGFEPNVEPTSNGGGLKKVGRTLSKEEKERVKSAIEAASSVDEIRRLQRMLAQGFVPSEKDLKDLQKNKSNGEVM